MSGRLGKYALPVSLAANVFFVVLIAVHVWHRPPFPPPGGPLGLVEEVARALPPADAVIFRAAFQADPLLRQPPPPGGAGFERINQALLAEPFDAAALEMALLKHQEEKQRFDEVLSAALLRAAGAMSADGRRRLVEWQMRHRPPHPHSGEQAPPPPPGR